LGLEYLAASCQVRGTEIGSNGRRENHVNGASTDNNYPLGGGQGEEWNDDDGENEGGGRGSGRGTDTGRMVEDDEEKTEKGAAGRLSKGIGRVGDGGGEQRGGLRQGQGQSEGQDSQESYFTALDEMQREMERDIEMEGEREREKERARQTGRPGVSATCLRGVVYFEGIGDIADIQAPLPRAQVRILPRA
jgi:hypothetical protein